MNEPARRNGGDRVDPAKLELLEARLHAEQLRDLAADALAPRLAEARELLLRTAEQCTLDLERVWLGIEGHLGLTPQQRELRRLVGEELSEQARPIGLSAVGGLIFFTSMGGGQLGLFDQAGPSGAPPPPEVAAAMLLGGDAGPAPEPVVATDAALPPELSSVRRRLPGAQCADRTRAESPRLRRRGSTSDTPRPSRRRRRRSSRSRRRPSPSS